MLSQRRRRWANIVQALGRCVVFSGINAPDVRLLYLYTSTLIYWFYVAGNRYLHHVYNIQDSLHVLTKLTLLCLYNIYYITNQAEINLGFVDQTSVCLQGLIQYFIKRGKRQNLNIPPIISHKFGNKICPRSPLSRSATALNV